MNRPERRAFDKRVRRGQVPAAEELQVCPVCHMLAHLIYVPHPTQRGEAVPVCTRCDRIVGPHAHEHGIVAGTRYVLPGVK